MKPVSAGVIAAGEGSRFRKAGIRTPKPMITVNGYPLVGHTLQRFQKAGVRRVVIIFNSAERSCVKWVRRNFPDMKTEFIVKSTKSSFESFCRVVKKLGPGRHLVSTVDSICSLKDIQKMLSARANRKVCLGLTTFVDDEKPLFAGMDRSGRIVSLGGKSGRWVTAGLYSVPGTLSGALSKGKWDSLRLFLGHLVQSGYTVNGIKLSHIVDVDRPEDIKTAENFLRSH